MDITTSDNNSIDSSRPKPVVLLLLDGWGIASASEANIISLVNTTNFSDLAKSYPVAALDPGDKSLNCRYLSLGAGEEIDNEESITEVDTLTKTLSDNNLKQIKIAETERFAPATYYFNGWQEEKIIGEEQKIISSNIDSPVKEVTKEIVKAIKNGDYNFIFSVMADIDLVANKGDLDKLRETIETVDENLRKIVNEVLDKKGTLIISSTGGNAEKMKNLAAETMDTDISNNPVPVIIIGEEFKDKNVGLIDPPNNDLSLLAPIGALADLGPTILQIFQIKQPQGMTGKSLIN